MTTSSVSSVDASLEALADLGFSELEGRVYSYLLGGAPATGYRIAQEIDKPTANTYKAISSLEAKGAVWIDHGESRVCRAVPPSELLARLARSFQERRERAAVVLAELHQADADGRVYQVRTVDAVLERARTMIGEAERVVLVDLFPRVLDQLRPDLLAATARGVEVSVKLYRPDELPGARVVVARTEVSRDAWPGEQISLVVDACQHLLALLDADLRSVHQAFWSESTFLSCMHHNHVANEILLTLYQALGPLPIAFQEILNEAEGITLLRSRPRGLEALCAAYGGNIQFSHDSGLHTTQRLEEEETK